MSLRIVRVGKDQLGSDLWPRQAKNGICLAVEIIEKCSRGDVCLLANQFNSGFLQPVTKDQVNCCLLDAGTGLKAFAVAETTHILLHTNIIAQM